MATAYRVTGANSITAAQQRARLLARANGVTDPQVLRAQIVDMTNGVYSVVIYEGGK